MRGTCYLNQDAIPQDLKAIPRWICLRVTPVDGGRWEKLPTSPVSGSQCSYTDANNWWSFSDAFNGLEMPGNNTVAFVPQEEDNLVFVDLDDCVDQSGQIEPWAGEIVNELASYTEWSLSGTGLHIICRGRIPKPRAKGNGVEMYSSRQPIAVTGHIVPGVPSSIEERQDGLDRLWEFTTRPVPPRESPGRHHQRSSDQEVLSRARAAGNGEKFCRLFDEGNTSEYESHSEADLALCSILLYWCNGDENQADALFRESALFRKKWDARHGSDPDGRGRTYGEMTLRKALEKPMPRGWVGGREHTGRPNNESLTDLGNAERLVRFFGDEIRFDTSLGKWRCWDGMIWGEDKDGKVFRLFAEVTRRMAQEAKSEPSEDRAAAMRKFSVTSQSKSKIEAAIALARNLEGITVQADSLDKDPLLLNLQNGTFDLGAGRFRPASREDYLTKLAAAAYDPMATCPRWERFLEEVFDGNRGVIDFVQRAVGYSLSGLMEERVIIFLHGNGANGKSVFLRLVSALLADYGVRMPSDSFVVQKASGIPNDIATTKGARLICGSELEPNVALRHALVKQLTGGDDVTARFLFHEHFTFTPTGKIWLATNHLPELNGGDQAIWDRVRVIPFPRRFEPKDQDPQLAESLLQELPGILNWAIAGFREWRRMGLGSTEALENAVAAYRDDSDQVGRFVKECCFMDPQAKVLAKVLRNAYEAWTRDEGVEPLPTKEVAERLTGLGFRDGKSGSARWWKGLGLFASSKEEETSQTEVEAAIRRRMSELPMGRKE